MSPHQHLFFKYFCIKPTVNTFTVTIPSGWRVSMRFVTNKNILNKTIFTFPSPTSAAVWHINLVQLCHCYQLQSEFLSETIILLLSRLFTVLQLLFYYWTLYCCTVQRMSRGRTVQITNSEDERQSRRLYCKYRVQDRDYCRLSRSRLYWRRYVTLFTFIFLSLHFLNQEM